MQIAQVVSSRSTCKHHQVGAVLVKNGKILTTGYNGAPSGQPHCLDIGCLRDDIPSGTRHEICRAVHAEQNAIIQAALHGISVKGATLYCTHQPCILCAKMIVNAGAERVMFNETYNDNEALTLLHNAGILVSCASLLTKMLPEIRSNTEERFSILSSFAKAALVPRGLGSVDIERARDTIKLVMQKMLDPKVDWNDTVFCVDDTLSDTLFERLIESYIGLGGKDVCDCGGTGCKECNHTGFRGG